MVCRSRVAFFGSSGESIDAHDARANDYDDLVRELFKVHPLEMFDELFVGDEQAQRRGIRLIEDLMRHNKNPIDVVSDDAVITWCSGDLNSRYPLATAAVTLFRRPNDKSDHEWTPLASKLVRHAPEPMAVLDCIIARLHPTSWSGSLTAKLESRAKLLAQLDVGTNPELTRAVSEARAGLLKEAEACRRAETEEDRARSGRFE